MASSIETRVTKLEQTSRNRRVLAVLMCEDGDQEQAAADYLASIPVDQHPEHVVVVRTFRRAEESRLLRVTTACAPLSHG